MGSYDDRDFRLRVEVPREVRDDPAQLRRWLEGMAADLMDPQRVHIDEDAGQEDAGGNAWIEIVMSGHPCPGRIPVDDDPDAQGDDGDDGDENGDHA